MAAFFATACFSLAAHAQDHHGHDHDSFYDRTFSTEQSKNVHTLRYVLNPPDKTYNMAWRAMAESFVSTTYDQSLPYVEKPYLMVAKTDLNNDGKPDYIAYPLEWNEYDRGAFTLPDSLRLVHYIYTGALDAPVILGKVFANAIDIGDETRHGYKTLKVFVYEDDAEILHPERFDFYDTYEFDPNTGQYEKAADAPRKNNAKKTEHKPK